MGKANISNMLIAFDRSKFLVLPDGRNINRTLPYHGIPVCLSVIDITWRDIKMRWHFLHLLNYFKCMWNLLCKHIWMYSMCFFCCCLVVGLGWSGKEVERVERVEAKAIRIETNSYMSEFQHATPIQAILQHKTIQLFLVLSFGCFLVPAGPWCIKWFAIHCKMQTLI